MSPQALRLLFHRFSIFPALALKEAEGVRISPDSHVMPKTIEIKVSRGRRMMWEEMEEGRLPERSSDFDDRKVLTAHTYKIMQDQPIVECATKHSINNQLESRE